MKKKLEKFDTTSKNFIETMEQLVSNDKAIRENAFPNLKIYLKNNYENNIELYQKISRSLFYFFFNTDKPNYQLSMAKLISNLIFINDNNKLIPAHEIWINTFLSEFGKKFKSIDVLRLDKYIMLCDQVISTYLVACLENNEFNSVINLINYFSQEIKNNPSSYNFSFGSNKIKIINRFINILFEENIEIKNKQNFINNNFINLFTKLLEFYSVINDKREIDFFEKNILENLINLISKIKLDNKYTNLISNIKQEAELFFEKNKNSLVKNKFDAIDFFINKIKDENYKKEEKNKKEVIDPVNEYIMNKKYKQKFRKSKAEIKKEKINKKESEKNKEKNIKINKNKKDLKNIKPAPKNIDIDIDNIETEKEIINLDNNDEEKKEKKIIDKEIKESDKNRLNKKTKRNKDNKEKKQKK